jgi:hypothetical protein
MQAKPNKGLRRVQGELVGVEWRLSRSGHWSLLTDRIEVYEMQMLRFFLVVVCLGFTPAFAQAPSVESRQLGPTKDVTYHVLWLIESDDTHRVAYSGPARDGLTAAGYGRLVPAGAATAAVTIGQRSTVSGASRYGQSTISTTMLNTTEAGELQIEIQLQTQSQTPLSIETTARVPMGRWFLVGAAESRVGLPQHADDGKRGVAIMRIDDGVMLLD